MPKSENTGSAREGGGNLSAAKRRSKPPEKTSRPRITDQASEFAIRRVAASKQVTEEIILSQLSVAADVLEQEAMTKGLPFELVVKERLNRAISNRRS